MRTHAFVVTITDYPGIIMVYWHPDQLIFLSVLIGLQPTGLFGSFSHKATEL